MASSNKRNTTARLTKLTKRKIGPSVKVKSEPSGNQNEIIKPKGEQSPEGEEQLEDEDIEEDVDVQTGIIEYTSKEYGMLQRGARMEEFEGSRPGTKVYMCPNKYMYRMDRGTHGDEVLYYKCSSAKCLGRAISYRGVLSYRSKHCHGPLVAQAEAHRFRAELRRRATNDTGDLETIFLQTQVLFREAAVQAECGFEQVRGTMVRARNADRPPPPVNLVSAALSIQDPQFFDQYAFSLGPGKRNLFHGMVVDAHERRAMLLKSADVMDFITMHTQEDQSLHLYIDTSYPITTSGGCNHLMTINLEYRHCGFPLLFALMEAKDHYMYVSVLTEFITLLENVTISSISVVHDQELKNAVTEVLPNVAINNSWFYYSAAVYKQADQLKLLEMEDKDLRQAIKMTMCLPLLPTDYYIENGWMILWNHLNNDMNGKREMTNPTAFTLYMEAEWFCKGIFEYKRISEYIDDSFKRSLIRIVKKERCSFWTLYKNIQLLEHSYGLKLIRVYNDRDIFLAPKRGFQDFQKHLNNSVSNLHQSGNIEQFLKFMASKLMYIMWIINKYSSDTNTNEDEDSETDNDLMEATDSNAHKDARRKMLRNKGIVRKRATASTSSIDHNYMKPNI